MDQKLLDKWIAALESGKYPQTMGVLKNDEGYCCLGVLCTVAGLKFEDELTPLSLRQDVDKGYGYRLQDASKESYKDHVVLSRETMSELELDDFVADRLIQLNDSGVFFKEIARCLRDPAFHDDPEAYLEPDPDDVG